MMVSNDVRHMAMELKGRTGAGVLDCKKALVMCNMDVDIAEKYLSKYKGRDHGMLTTRVKPEEGINGS